MDENIMKESSQAAGSENPEINWAAQGVAADLHVVDGAKKGDTQETKTMKESFGFFGPMTAAYALLYAFCMYRNESGITFPFFMAGSLFYFCFSFKKLGITLKKGSAFYMISVMLLAVSTFCTDDDRIIAFNKTGIFLLMISFLLEQFCSTKDWGLGKYLGSIINIVFSSICELIRPFADAVDFAGKRKFKNSGKALYVLLGLAVSAPLIIIVMVLLSSADLIFRQLTENMFMSWDFDDIFGVGFSIVFWFFGVYLLMSRLCKRVIRDEVKDHRNGEPILAITVTTMLSMIYLVFSAIQILYLFLGQMQLPEGYTYAEYAREGFFQLLAVSILNLVIVLMCLAYFRESKILKAVLTVMSLCTYIMIASSALRMMIYIETYNLTFLRIIVLWALVVLSLLFGGVLIQIYRSKFPLFRYSMSVVTVLYLCLAFSHPDYIIAKVNLENAGAQMDYRYLSNLCADAAPYLIPYLEDHGYDLSVIEFQIDKDEIRDSRQLKSALNTAYWKRVRESRGDNELNKSDASGFGYTYLNSICWERNEMGFRNFNLSRFWAVRLAEK